MINQGFALEDVRRFDRDKHVKRYVLREEEIKLTKTIDCLFHMAKKMHCVYI